MAQNSHADASELVAKGLRYAPVYSQDYVELKSLMRDLRAAGAPAR